MRMSDYVPPAKITTPFADPTSRAKVRVVHSLYSDKGLKELTEDALQTLRDIINDNSSKEECRISAAKTVLDFTIKRNVLEAIGESTTASQILGTLNSLAIGNRKKD